jgi:hypothetical protein
MITDFGENKPENNFENTEEEDGGTFFLGI